MKTTAGGWPPFERSCCVGRILTQVGSSFGHGLPLPSAMPESRPVYSSEMEGRRGTIGTFPLVTCDLEAAFSALEV